MTRHTVDLARLRDVVEQMAQFEADLNSALEDVDSRVTRLHDGWTGQAAKAHRAAHRRWRQGATEMHQALVTMRGIAETAHSNYSSAVAANTRMWDL
ncbi:MAG TPA: WXG100 family type VII secretion target [Mycobacteriales bacterium]|nr:WXG100 family type VII secretion target [Mycobacteriales bacterium]